MLHIVQGYAVLMSCLRGGGLGWFSVGNFVCLSKFLVRGTWYWWLCWLRLNLNLFLSVGLFVNLFVSLFPMLACYDRSPILRGGMGDDGYQKEAELDASDRDTDTDATNNEKCDKSSNGPGNCCQWNQDKLGCNNLRTTPKKQLRQQQWQRQRLEWTDRATVVNGIKMQQLE